VKLDATQPLRLLTLIRGIRRVLIGKASVDVHGLNRNAKMSTVISTYEVKKVKELNMLARVFTFCSCAVFAWAIFVFCLGSAANADQEEHYDDLIAQAEQYLSEAKQAVIESNGELADVEQYLYSAMFYIYYGKLKANMNFDSNLVATNDLKQLMSLGYLSEWPGNPLNNWEPIEVLSPEDAFAPGELVFALCPTSYASLIRGNQLAQASFEMFVYGPVADVADKFTSITQHESNKEWSTPPDGALFGLSYYAESNHARLERERRLKEKKEKAGN
jgi:hypothetical protein